MNFIVINVEIESSGFCNRWLESPITYRHNYLSVMGNLTTPPHMGRKKE